MARGWSARLHLPSSSCFGLMNRRPSTATHEPVDIEPDNGSPLLWEGNHGGLQTAYVLGESSSKGKTGANGSLLNPQKSKLPVHLLVVALLLTISLCTQKLRSTLRKGMQQRRLAGGGEESEDTGDEAGPPSPDFTEFCLELGAWIPSNPLPGDPRSSPGLVESFFESLDQSVEQPAAQPPPPTAAPVPPQLLLAPPKAGDKRPLEESDVEALRGPSSKVAKTMQDSSSHFVDPGTSSSMLSHLLQTASAPQPSPSTSASSDVAAFSSAGPGGLGAQHPFVQLPRLEPGAKPRQFVPSTMRSASFSSQRSLHLLRAMREAFRKSQLNEVEAQNLVFFSERLAAHAYHTMQDTVEGLGPFDSLSRLARKFMVLYYLLRASNVLGQNWPSQPWWEELMKRIPHEYFYAWERDPRASPFNARLANELSAAIGQLKRGVLPAPKIIISLKRRLFCLPHSPYLFKDKQWDPWRQEDEDSQKPPETSRTL
ncbi:hypothetical protein Emed_003676 [Eimeria media]